MPELPQGHFNGPHYFPLVDDERLTGQIRRVYDLMTDQKWRTLREIEQITGDPQASISAQLRHLRKKRFGFHRVQVRRRGDPLKGLFEYQLLPPLDREQLEFNLKERTPLERLKVKVLELEAEMQVWRQTLTGARGDFDEAPGEDWSILVDAIDSLLEREP